MRIKITPKAIDVWFSFDFITGEIAAIALPPQIAVPHEIKCDVFLSVFNHFPKRKPKVIVLKIEKTVRAKPSFPAENAFEAFIPKPKPTTENCNKNVTALWLNSKNGFPKTFTIITPSNKAAGGEIIENKHNIIMTAKMNCCRK